MQLNKPDQNANNESLNIKALQETALQLWAVDQASALELGRGVGELLLELANLFLLLAKQGLRVVEFHLQATIDGLQFGDALLGVGLLQFNDTTAQGGIRKADALSGKGSRPLREGRR